MPRKPPRITKEQAEMLDRQLDALQPDAKSIALKTLIRNLHAGITSAREKGANWQQIADEVRHICERNPEHFRYMKGMRFAVRDISGAWKRRNKDNGK